MLTNYLLKTFPGQTKDQKNLTGIYTEDKIGDAVNYAQKKGIDVGKVEGLADFLKGRNPKLAQAYSEDKVSPFQAYQIASQGNVKDWGKPKAEVKAAVKKAPSSSPVLTEAEKQSIDPRPFRVGVTEGLTLPESFAEDIVVDEETINRYIKNAQKWAGTVKAEEWEGQYPHRQPGTIEENKQYVGDYIKAAMVLAPYYDLPPKPIAGMLMEESGWGGQRFDGNLGGYGFLEGGTDMGFRFDAPTIAGQAQKYLEAVSKGYGGSRSPDDFHKRGYNQHVEYPGKINSIIGMLEAQ